MDEGYPELDVEHHQPVAKDASGLTGAEVFYYTSPMSMRDYFAGQALAGFCAATGTDTHDSILARRCYEVADKMLKAREGQQ